MRPHLFGHIVGNVVIERPNLDLGMRFERLVGDVGAETTIDRKMRRKRVGKWSAPRYVESPVFVDDVQAIESRQSVSHGNEPPDHWGFPSLDL